MKFARSPGEIKVNVCPGAQWAGSVPRIRASFRAVPHNKSEEEALLRRTMGLRWGSSGAYSEFLLFSNTHARERSSPMLNLLAVVDQKSTVGIVARASDTLWVWPPAMRVIFPLVRPCQWRPLMNLAASANVPAIWNCAAKDLIFFLISRRADKTGAFKSMAREEITAVTTRRRRKKRGAIASLLTSLGCFTSAAVYLNYYAAV